MYKCSFATFFFNSHKRLVHGKNVIAPVLICVLSQFLGVDFDELSIRKHVKRVESSSISLAGLHFFSHQGSKRAVVANEKQLLTGTFNGLSTRTNKLFNLSRTIEKVKVRFTASIRIAVEDSGKGFPGWVIVGLASIKKSFSLIRVGQDFKTPAVFGLLKFLAMRVVFKRLFQLEKWKVNGDFTVFTEVHELTIVSMAAVGIDQTFFHDGDQLKAHVSFVGMVLKQSLCCGDCAAHGAHIDCCVNVDFVDWGLLGANLSVAALSHKSVNLSFIQFLASQKCFNMSRSVLLALEVGLDLLKNDIGSAFSMSNEHDIEVVTEDGLFWSVVHLKVG